MSKLRQLEERLREQMAEAGCVSAGYRCKASEFAARDLHDQINAVEEQIADSRRMLGILSGSGITAAVLILIELLRVRGLLNSFDVSIIALCAVDLMICMAGAVAELRKIANAKAEPEKEI